MAVVATMVSGGTIIITTGDPDRKKATIIIGIIIIGTIKYQIYDVWNQNV